MKRYLIATLIVVALLLGLALADPYRHAQASGDLYHEVEAATGIFRSIDPTLIAIAERRAREIQSDWSHSGIADDTTEVLVYTDVEPWTSRTVALWMASPSHAPIILDPRYERIGCAETYGPGIASGGAPVHWVACVLAPRNVPRSHTSPNQEPHAEPTPTPEATTPPLALDAYPDGRYQPLPLLPDTAVAPAIWTVDQ